MWSFSYMLARISQLGASFLNWEDRLISKVGVSRVAIACAIFAALLFSSMPGVALALLFIIFGIHVTATMGRFGSDASDESPIPSWLAVPGGFMAGVVIAILIWDFFT